MKVTRVEAIYLRQPEVKYQCDSGQDALIVRVETDAGITGIGEVDSRPDGRQGCDRRAVLAYHRCRPGAGGHRRRPVRNRDDLWHKMYRANIYGGRRGVGPARHERHRHGPVGHQGKGARPAGLEAAGRRVSPEDSLLRQLAVRPDAGKDGRAGPPLPGPGFHGREVRLGPDGPGREDRHRPGARGPQGAGRRTPTC